MTSAPATEATEGDRASSAAWLAWDPALPSHWPQGPQPAPAYPPCLKGKGVAPGGGDSELERTTRASQLCGAQGGTKRSPASGRGGFENPRKKAREAGAVGNIRHRQQEARHLFQKPQPGHPEEGPGDKVPPSAQGQRMPRQREGLWGQAGLHSCCSLETPAHP